jgi:hypothetical protein
VQIHPSVAVAVRSSTARILTAASSVGDLAIVDHGPGASK